MGLTNAPDINNSIDLNITSNHIEKKQKGGNETNDTIENINSKLQLDGLKLELPKTIEQKEKEIHNNIYQDAIFKGTLEKGLFKQGIKVTYISENLYSVFSNKTNNISFFANKEGKTLIEVPYRINNFIDKDNKFLKISLETFKQTGYFIDSKNQTRDIYKIIGEDENGEFILSNSPLDKNSIDYFNALKNVINYYDTFEILLSLKHKWDTGKGNIDDYIRSGALNLKFLQLFKNKNFLETPDTFEYAIKNMKITIQDIVTAKNNGDITEEEGREIYNILQATETKSLD